MESESESWKPYSRLKEGVRGVLKHYSFGPKGVDTVRFLMCEKRLGPEMACRCWLT